jgi:hypothetical protein
MSDLKHIHNAIIDNPDFNLTVAAKRDLRELCAWVESYRKDGQKVLDENNGRIEQLEAALHFYADNHKRPNEGPWGASSNDFGKVAIAALEIGLQIISNSLRLR